MSSSNSSTDPQSSPLNNKWAPEKIWRVVRDIKDSPKTSLLSLLTALLARLLLDDQDTEASELSFSEKVKESKCLVDLILRDTTSFCKDESNVRATDLKKQLRD